MNRPMTGETVAIDSKSADAVGKGGVFQRRVVLVLVDDGSVVSKHVDAFVRSSLLKKLPL